MERGWTQKQLAEAASLRPNTITNIIKHGKDADTATLSRVAAAFGIDLVELFVTPEQSHILRAYRENRIERLKEVVLSEVSGTITRLLREDYERTLESARHHQIQGKTRKRRPKRQKD